MYLTNYDGLISIYSVSHFAALLMRRVLVPNLSPSNLRAFLILSESKHNPKATHLDYPCSSKINNKITSEDSDIGNTNTLASKIVFQLSFVGVVGKRTDENFPISLISHRFP